MAISRLDYLEYFLNSVSMCENGAKHAISENKNLINNYCSDYYETIFEYLSHNSGNVRSEIVLFFSEVNERRAYNKVKEMRYSDTDLVSCSCEAYLKHFNDSSDLVEDLLKIMNSKSGADFRNAALKLGKIGDKSIVPEIRKMYVFVPDKSQKYLNAALENIIERFPELEKNRHLILSKHVFPNEKEFIAFLDKSIVYLDIRYRDNISDLEDISMKTYNNIVGALKKMQVRLYNERNNLKYYSEETKKSFDTLEELVVWVSEDLLAKNVEKPTATIERVRGRDEI